MKILVTGGLGFLGSHIGVELLENNDEVVVVDNLFNSKMEVKDKIQEITGKEIKVYIGDCADEILMDKVFLENAIDSVIHCAGLKAVGESVEKPVWYYQTNLGTTLNLLKVMQNHQCKKIIFSSTATVYGVPEKPQVDETFETGKTTNPYATSKYMIERILEDVYVSDKTWSIGILRYFNPIGAHKSGLIGEEPNGIPNNLMPYILKVAKGELPVLSVFGDDYDTPDGTGVRDYIHVVDLAKAHLKAVNKLKEGAGIYKYNLGTGIGYSVLDIIRNFEKVNGIKVNYKIAPRRAGDVAACYSNPAKAEREMGWKAEKNIEDMCKDAWNFAKNK